MRKKGLISVVVFPIVLILVGMSVINGCAKGPKPTPTPVAKPVKWVKVGSIADLTGPCAPEVAAMHYGHTQYFEYLNEKGGIETEEYRVKIKELWADTRYEIPEMISAYKRFKRAGVILILSSLSPAFATIKDWLAEDKIPAIHATGANVTLIWPPSWIYGHLSNSVDQLGYHANWFLQRWDKPRKPRYALMYSDDAFGRGVLNGGPAYVKEKGFEIVASEPVKMAAVSAESQLMRVKKAKPDVIYTNLIVSTTSVVLKDKKRLGIEAPLVVGAWVIGPKVVRLAGKEATEGTYLVDHYLPFWWPESKPAEISPEAETVIKVFNKNHPGKSMTGEYLYGIVSGLVAKRAIELALQKVGVEELDGAALKKYGLDRIKDYKTGFLPPIAYTPDDHRGISMARMMQYQMVNGKIREVDLEKEWHKTPCITPKAK